MESCSNLFLRISATLPGQVYFKLSIKFFKNYLFILKQMNYNFDKGLHILVPCAYQKHHKIHKKNISTYIYVNLYFSLNNYDYNAINH